MPVSPWPDGPRYDSLQVARTSLRLLAPVVATACMVVGASLFLGKAYDLTRTSFALGERAVLGMMALVYLGGGVVAGLVAFRLLRATSELLGLWLDQAIATQRTARVFEQELLPTLERLARAMEASAAARTGPPAEPRSMQELHDALQDARKRRDLDELLDIRLELVARVDARTAADLDRQIAQWLVRHVREELQAGQAARVAGPLPRVVEELEHVADIQQIAVALPMIQRSARFATAREEEDDLAEDDLDDVDENLEALGGLGEDEPEVGPGPRRE